jgi:hypothetical protein
MAMHRALEAFCNACRETLKAQPGPAGRAEVARLLEQAVSQPAFREACFEAGEPGRRTLYEDPELGFCVLAYDMAEPRISPPHDHGPSWAVYGQVDSHTDMTEFERVDGGTGAGPAKLKEGRHYRLSPGQVGLYDTGAIHRIDYPAGAKFVRVTGTDMERVPRLKYDQEAGHAIEMAGTSVPS